MCIYARVGMKPEVDAWVEVRVQCTAKGCYVRNAEIGPFMRNAEIGFTRSRGITRGMLRLEVRGLSKTLT